MGERVGRRLGLSPARRFVCDLMYFARKVPTVPVQRRMNIASLAAARNESLTRPSWCALFTHAFARVAEKRPELRRAYVGFPWGQLYEHPCSIASIAIERKLGDEDAVFFVQVRAPEHHAPHQIDEYLKDCKARPINEVGTFRRTLWASRFPWFIRHMLWWIGLNVSGYKRARNWGTFGVSVYSGLGAESLHPLSPLTTALNYGVIGDDGSVDVRLIYDHRVLDGAPVARALAEMEELLNGPIAEALVATRRNGVKA